MKKQVISILIKNTMNKPTLINLPDNLKQKAKGLSTQILGKENVSAIIRYLINKEKLKE